jgi:amino acid transporter
VLRLWEWLLGRPLRSEEEHSQRIGLLRGIPFLGLDALASAAYGPEAALTVLLALGAGSVRWLTPISTVIIIVLALVFVSYRQTIAAYPGGGGSYTVATENLGATPGLLAAAALAVDYILNAAVAISAGVGAIASAVPALLPHTLALCLTILALLTISNLRGVRESGALFMMPTYLFLACMAITLVMGGMAAFSAHGHPVARVLPPRHGAPAAAALSVWLLLRAFASGCTAMTGVEAVSNGVPIFKEPTVRTAQRTLTAIVLALMVLLAGIALLSRSYGIVATTPGSTGYRSVLSQLVAAVAGTGVFYYVTIASIFAILSLSANTSFAGFPRLCRLLALDEYLPAEFAYPGRRLVFSVGIVALAVLAGILLIVFHGITDRLIPLFAVGAFVAFTMSQAGMVAHWRRTRGPGWRRSLVVNAMGATATALTLAVIVVSKFMEGAWVTLFLIGALLLLFRAVRHNADRIDAETDVRGPVQLDEPPPPIVVVPIKALDRVARKSLRLAITMSPDVQVAHVLTGEPDLDDLRAQWPSWVEEPLRAAGFTPPELVTITSAYREFYGPLLDHLRRVADEHPRRYVAVLVPELVQHRWYHFLLHSHRQTFLKGLLLLRGGPRIVVVNAPWYLRDQGDDDPQPVSPSSR